MTVSSDLQSMTGFASVSALTDAASINCEIRSVNGKGLDIRLRLPDGLESEEQAIKKIAAEKLARGNLQVSVSIEPVKPAALVRIDEALFYALADQAKALAAAADLAPPSSDAILSLRGVVVADGFNSTLEVDDALRSAIIALATQTVDDLAAARREEGAVIGGLLSAQLRQIEALVQSATADPALDSAHILANLKAQLNRLIDVDDNTVLDADRLHAEAAMLATKGDVREEIDRLNAHIAATRDLLAKGGAVGRKLDFMAQEFNREANTLCAKASTTSLKAIGLEIKAVIDQMKEQAANIQ